MYWIFGCTNNKTRFITKYYDFNKNLFERFGKKRKNLFKIGQIVLNNNYLGDNKIERCDEKYFILKYKKSEDV